MTEADAVVIGSGINGLVAGALLARAGWRIIVVERNSSPGGCLATEELTVPGYRHDTFASWHGMFCAGPAWLHLRDELEVRGLRYRSANRVVTATVRPDGSVVSLYRDPIETATHLSQEDGQSYLAQLEQIRRLNPLLGRVMCREWNPRTLASVAFGAARRVGIKGLRSFSRDAVSSLRAWSQRYFAGADVDALLGPWLLHAGLTPDSAGGALAALVMAAGLHTQGMPVAVGGSGQLVSALCGLVEDHGGRLLTGVEATEIRPAGSGANDVIAGDHVIRARRAVLASTSPVGLYCGLLRNASAVRAVQSEAGRFRYGRAAMQIHLALSSPLHWNDPAVDDVPLVHLSEGSASVAVACAQADAGLLPARPTVVVGQQHVLDASRVPPGAAALWIQLQELPRQLRGDAGGDLADAREWSPPVVDRYVERVLTLIEAHAPDLRSLIVGRAVLTPPDLERRNPNLVGGDPYAGSAELDQGLVFRPSLGMTRHRTAVAGVWHIGASTRPGPGLGGASGFAVAAALLGRRMAAPRAPSRGRRAPSMPRPSRQLRDS